jgi:hypothetical protein
MSTTNYVAIAVVIMLASIVYEFTVMSWVIAKQKDEGEWRRRDVVFRRGR